MGRCAKLRSQRAVRAACCLLAAFAAPAQGGVRVHYTVDATGVSLADAEMTLQITMRIDAPPGERTVFAAPVWTPGSYRLRDFPERIAPVSARAGERALAVARLSPRSWEVVHGPAAWVELGYRVTVRNGDRFLHPGKQRRCLTYEGPAVYLYVQRLLSAPCTVGFALPDGWSQASALAAGSDGTFAAADYDVLADCMVKLGRFQQFEFDSLGAHFTAVVDDEHDLEITPGPWLDGLRAIAEEGAMVFGGRYPFARYWFLFTVSPRGEGGGLEHLASTGIGLPRGPFSRDPSSSLGVCAHEFFHCWNVKRLRPTELGPFRYDRPNRTTGLWLSEGVTSYYAELLRARAGQVQPAAFWLGVRRAIERFENMPGRAFTSPEDASLRVWDRQSPDRTVDYYTAGEVLGLLLDLQIRAASGNQRGLDDAMAAMFAQCEREHRGLTAAEIEAACSTAAGHDLDAFFAACVRGTSVPDYRAILGAAGVDLALEERTEKVLRGLDLTHDRPAFTDLRALDQSGGGDPAAITGHVQKLGERAVASVAEAKEDVETAVAAGATSLAVEFARGNGTIATAPAAVEERRRVRVNLTPQNEPAPPAQAIRDGLTRSRRAR